MNNLGLNIKDMRFFLSTIVACILCMSCQNDISIEQITPHKISTIDNKVTYPLFNTITRSNNEFDTSWETISQVTLPSGILVYTPWNTTMSSTTVPTNFRTDIKKADGWKLIAHTLNSSEKGLNYLFFYNQFTGFLKTFYYLENNFAQTTGLWHIHIDRPQGLLAFTEGYTRPANSKEKIQDVYCSNISINEDKPFSQGWNCFEVELAYDPQFSGAFLTIEPCGILKSQIEMSGEYNSKSEGHIITIGANNKGVQKSSGADAQKQIKDIVSYVPKDIVDLGSLTSSSSLRDLVVKGIGSIFKGLTSRTKKDKPEEYQLQYTTNGEITLSGEITSKIYSGFPPITINIGKEYVGSLGLWNVSLQPIIEFNTLGRLIQTSETTFPIYRIYGAGNDYCYFNINPDAVCKETKTSYQIFTCPNNEYRYSDSNGPLSGGMSYSGVGEYLINDIYKQKAVEFKIYVPGVDNHKQRELPEMVYLYDSKNEFGTKFGIKNNYIIKAQAYFNIDDNIEVTSTKTFVPTLRWRTDNLQHNSIHKEEYDTFWLQQYRQ